MLKSEWGTESNGKLTHIFIPSETATLVPEFSVEDLPFDRTAALVPEFAEKDQPLGRTLMMMMMMVSIPSGPGTDRLCRHYILCRHAFTNSWTKHNLVLRPLHEVIWVCPALVSGHFWEIWFVEHQMILYMYDLRSIFYYEYIHHYTSFYY